MPFIQQLYEVSRKDQFVGLFSPSLGAQLANGNLGQIAAEAISPLVPSFNFADSYDFSTDVASFTLVSYINTLILKVTPPKDKFVTDEIDYGVFKIKLIKGIEISEFDVTFIEDRQNTVTNWYHAWVHSIVRPDFTMNAPGKCTLSFTLVRSGDGAIVLGQAAEIPRTLDIYPNVLPADLEDPGYDREEGGIRKIKLSFMRLLRIKPFRLSPTGNISKGLNQSLFVTPAGATYF